MDSWMESCGSVVILMRSTTQRVPSPQDAVANGLVPMVLDGPSEQYLGDGICSAVQLLEWRKQVERHFLILMTVHIHDVHMT